MGGAVCAGAATIGTAALQAYSPQQTAGAARLGRGPGEPVAGAPQAQQSGVFRETGASPRANPDSTVSATRSALQRNLDPRRLSDVAQLACDVSVSPLADVGVFVTAPGSWVICSVRPRVHRGAARGPARGTGGDGRARPIPPGRLPAAPVGHGPVPGPQGRHDAGRSSKTRSKRTILRVRKGCPSGRQRTSRTPDAAAWLRRSSRSRAAPAPRNVAPAQVEHERGVAAEPHAEVGLELAGRASRSPSSGTTVVRSAGARRLGRRLGRVARRGAGAVVIRESVSAAAAAAPAAGRPPPVRRRREETTIGPAPRTGTRSPEPAAGSSSPTTLWIPAPRTLPAHMTAGQQGVRPLINGRPGREGAGEAPGISRKRPTWTGSAATCAPTPTGYPRPVR